MHTDGKLPQSHLSFQISDSSYSYRFPRICRSDFLFVNRNKRFAVFQTQSESCRVCLSSNGRIGIRMSYPQRAFRLYKPIDYVPAKTLSRHLMNRTEKQRMMTYKQIRALFNRFGNGFVSRIDRETNLFHIPKQVSRDKPGIIPAFRVFKRIKRF